MLSRQVMVVGIILSVLSREAAAEKPLVTAGRKVTEIGFPLKASHAAKPAQKSSLYNSARYGFRVKVPDKWETSEESSNFITFRSPGRAAVVIYVIPDFDAPDSFSEKDIEDFIVGQINASEGYVLLDRGFTQLPNRRGAFFVSALLVKDGVNLKMFQVVTTRDGSLFLLWYEAEKAVYDTFRDQAIALLNSFEFLDEIPRTTPPPVANYTVSVTGGPAPLTVSFNNTSTGTGNGYSWSFGDGATSTATSPSHTFTAAGTYTARLTATNAGGTNSVAYTLTVTAPVAAPVASFTTSVSRGTAPLTVRFSNASTGTGNTYSWDFGDGSTSRAPNPAHTYTASGTYTVRLTAKNNGGSKSTTRTVTVSPAQAVKLSAASLTMDNTEVGKTSRKTVTLTNNTSATLTVSSVPLTGTDAAQFKVSPTRATIAANGNQVFTVSFTPTAAGAKRASLSIAHNQTGGPAVVALSGTATAAVVSDVTRVLTGTLSTTDQTFVDTKKYYDTYQLYLLKTQKLSLGLSTTAAIHIEGVVNWSDKYVDGQQAGFKQLSNMAVPQDGDYRIFVGGDRDGVTGSYTLTVKASPGPLVVEAVPLAKFVALRHSAEAEESVEADQPQLRGNYPNPFNAETVISYNIPTASKLRLVVYDLLGQQVRTLVEGELPAGLISVVWDGRDDQGLSVASGVYICHLEGVAGDELGSDVSLSMRMLLLR